MPLSGVDINVDDISSLIMEREGAERAMLGNLVRGSSPSGTLRCPCLLTWSSYEKDLHKCAYDAYSPFGVLFPISLTLPCIVNFCYYFYFLFIVLSSSLM